MAAEVEERYPLEDGLPKFQETPKPVKEFHQKYEHYPARVIVNPKHKVKWSEYPMPFSIPLRPSPKPLESNKDIEDAETPTAQFYRIAIKYDNQVDEKTLICQGFATI